MRMISRQTVWRTLLMLGSAGLVSVTVVLILYQTLLRPMDIGLMTQEAAIPPQLAAAEEEQSAKGITQTATNLPHTTGGYRKFVKTECEWCCTKLRPLQVHHEIPQRTILRMYLAGEITYERAKELLDTDRSNFVTLCDRCHFVVGHKCNWRNNVTNLPAILEAGKD